MFGCVGVGGFVVYDFFCGNYVFDFVLEFFCEIFGVVEFEKGFFLGVVECEFL